jgi:hypothetical protein
MVLIAKRLAFAGAILRTGGADGADAAFLSGTIVAGMGDKVELYLPWREFNRHRSCRAGLYRPTSTAYDLAAKHHPAWDKLGGAPRALHARNVHAVLGADCASPSDLLICWTQDGSLGRTSRRTGGTGQAIRVAVAHRVSIWNLQRDDHRGLWARWSMDEGDWPPLALSRYPTTGVV